MSAESQGRHHPGAHRRLRAHPSGSPWKAHGNAHALSRVLRRPLAAAAAILAVAGASAARPAASVEPVSGASFTASPMAVAQATELSRNHNDTNAALAEARRSGVQRASALTQQQKVAAAALVKARVDAAAALARARTAAAARVTRQRVRQGLLARAQSDPKAAGRLLAEDRGWGAQQFGCLESLWTKESGWRWNANNPSSGAYGIPQSLPGSKMASAGGDWATNPATQIRWGLSYIANRYGTPCSAWAHSQAVNWY